MLANIKTWFIRRLPRNLQTKIHLATISRRFRKSYRRWAAESQRQRDQVDQMALRHTFLVNGMKDLNWALRFEQGRRPFRKTELQGNFPGIGVTQEMVREAVAALLSDGVWTCPIRMSKQWVQSAVEQLNTLPVTSAEDSRDIQTPCNIRPRATVYRHDAADLEKNSLLVELSRDQGIREIIGRYLGCQPVFDTLAAWWTFPGAPSNLGAQMYHFDMDRIRWLKVFIYLSDVGPENGPHAFIKGSHRVIGERIKRDGRHSDAEAKLLFPELEAVELTGPAGTLFIEDTLGFHKGTGVTEGHRCVFEFEYSSGHFGYPYPASALDNT